MDNQEIKDKIKEKYGDDVAGMELINGAIELHMVDGNYIKISIGSLDPPDLTKLKTDSSKK